MIQTSSGLPQKSPAIFGNLQNFSENVRQRLCDPWTSFSEYLKSSRKSLEIIKKAILSIIKGTKTLFFLFSWQEQYLTNERSKKVRYCSCHLNIKFISSRHRVISSIY